MLTADTVPTCQGLHCRRRHPVGAAEAERRGEPPTKGGVQIQDSPSEGLPGLSHRAPGKSGERAHAEEVPKQVTQHVHEHTKDFTIASLVMCEWLSFSSSQSDPILAGGVPAVAGLHRLELEWVTTFLHI